MPFTRHRPSSTARGYNQRHRTIRATHLAALNQAGAGTCAIGGEPIHPGDNLHLDHCPHCKGNGCPPCAGSGYRGLACADHNRQDGARRGRARQIASPLRW